MTRRAIVNIFSSYNNILMTATDLTGAETITTCSGGQMVKSSKDSGGQFAATRAAEKLADALKDKEFTQLIVKYRVRAVTCLTTLVREHKLQSERLPVPA